MKRSVIFGMIGAVLLVAAVALSWLRQRSDQAEPPETAAAPPAASAPAAAAPVAPTTAPSFDVVRISPSGDAVIAGRAAPDAQVHVLDGGKEIGSVTADQRGQWVLLPNTPLPRGSNELSLRAERPGAAPALSDTVVVQVKPPATDAAPVVAAAAPPGSAAPTDGRTVIAKGNTLWGLAEHRYGAGERYETIYQANRDQIRNPDLIYPGQVFVMPPGR